MDFTPGELLFYGGIAGMALIGIISIAIIIILARSRRRLNKKFNDEYGGKRK